jgi:transposase-like protein
LAEVDILGPSDRRRIWSAQEKAALLAEVDAEGGKVCLVARRRGVSESLLYNWRAARKAAAVAAGAPEGVQFVPIGVLRGNAPCEPALLAPPEPTPAPEPAPADGKGGSIEITLPNGARVSVDGFVNEKALSRVLRAVQGLA